MPGLATQEGLEANMASACSEVSDARRAVEEVRNFTQKMLQLPQLHRNESMTAQALGDAIGVPDGHQICNEDFYKSLAQKVARDVQPTSGLADNSLMALETFFPASEFLKQGFFRLKELEEALGKQEAKHLGLQKKYQRVKDKLARRKELTGKVFKTREKAAADKQAKLSKRNFMNRMRNKVRKTKKIREMDDTWNVEAGHTRV